MTSYSDNNDEILQILSSVAKSVHHVQSIELDMPQASEIAKTLQQTQSEIIDVHSKLEGALLSHAIDSVKDLLCHLRQDAQTIDDNCIDRESRRAGAACSLAARTVTEAKDRMNTLSITAKAQSLSWKASAAEFKSHETESRKKATRFQHAACGLSFTIHGALLFIPVNIFNGRADKSMEQSHCCTLASQHLDAQVIPIVDTAVTVHSCMEDFFRNLTLSVTKCAHQVKRIGQACIVLEKHKSTEYIVFTPDEVETRLAERLSHDAYCDREDAWKEINKIDSDVCAHTDQLHKNLQKLTK